MRWLQKRCTMCLMKCAQLQKRCHRKMEKKKCQLGIFWANKLNKFIRIIRTWTSYLPFGNCYFFKAEKKKNNNNKFLRRNETAANEPTLKIWLINSYLGFIFVFHFSKSRQRYCNLVCTKRKRERQKERKEDWWNSKTQNLQRSIYFRYFTDLETRFLEMMMVERYLGA